jgi:hypothetical protein
MHTRYWLPLVAILLAGSSRAAAPPAPPALPKPAAATAPLLTGWSLLKEGQAEGTVEIDAKHATNPNPHLLKIAITKMAPFGEGRLGVKNAAPIAVKDGLSYDITFGGISEGISVGLVFSLETDDGKVLARTTLPEIGRGGGGGARGGRGRGPATTTAPDGAAAASAPATAPAAPAPAWRQYLLGLKARASAANAHLTITAIEPVPVWIENVSIVERPPSP